MWYATETVFIDGKLFASRCCFTDGDKSVVGHCYESLDAQPMNRCEKHFDNRIEIHTDWFESEELAHKFCDGLITYKHIYDTYYDKSIKSTLSKFKKREIVEVDEKNEIYPHKGIYEMNPLDYKPYWVR